MGSRKLLSILILTVFMAILPFTKQTEAAVSPYQNAVNLGESLKKETTAFNAKIAAGNIYEIDRAYDAFTKKIKNVELAIGKVSGSANRTSLSTKYVKAAKVEKERVIYEVSQLRLMKATSNNINAKFFDMAQQNMGKLSRLKSRAIAIKEAGGYKAVPGSIAKELSWFEGYLKKAVKNSYLINDLGQFVYIDFDTASKHITINGIAVGDSFDRVQAIWGKPTFSHPNMGEYFYTFINGAYETAYEEEVYFYIENSKVVDVFYDNMTPKGDGYSKEFLEAFEGEIFKSTAAYNTDYEVLTAWYLKMPSTEGTYLEVYETEDGNGLQSSFYFGKDFEAPVASEFTKVDKAAAIQNQLTKK